MNHFDLFPHIKYHHMIVLILIVSIVTAYVPYSINHKFSATSLYANHVCGAFVCT